MKYSGNLRKMKVHLANPVNYELPVGEDLIDMNALLGKTLRLSFTGEIHCIACGRKTSKSFNQGYCYPCMRSLPECDSCIVKPEKCHFHEGTCRDDAWGLEHCMQDHIVYLANSSGIKVGITRQSQVPTRWIDQGAVQALPMLRTKNRYMSGLVEMQVKQHVADKTDWRKMLKADPGVMDLEAERERLLVECAPDFDAIRTQHGEDAIRDLQPGDVGVNISYPVHEYPQKVKSLGFDKVPVLEAKLEGIKGQYLIFDSGVINMRKHAGYKIEFEVL